MIFEHVERKTVMSDTIKWQGVSGMSYEYWIYPINSISFSAVAGNYCVAKEVDPGRFRPLYFGERLILVNGSTTITSGHVSFGMEPRIFMPTQIQVRKHVSMKRKI
jgi:hypothetical protein